MRRVFFLTVFIFAAFGIHAQQVIVRGNAPDYAGCVLTFHSADNYISNVEIRLGECTVASDGNFIVHLPCKNIRPINLHLGIFNVRFIAEPGFEYEVQLPPRTDKTPDEAASVFFEEIPVYMAILSAKNDKKQLLDPEKELNVLITRFDEKFESLHDYLTRESVKRTLTKADSIIDAFKQSTPRTGNRYFDDYVFYRTGLLYYAAQRSGVKYISSVYFTGKTVLYDNDAYMYLFDATYEKYFMYFGRTKEGEAIYDAINVKQSFGDLKRLLGSDGVLPSDSLRELVILKNIHDEFYSDRFSRQALLHLLDSAAWQTKIERHKEIAGEIRSKITKLLRGFAPPDFSLYNQDSTLVSLQNYKGKYVYLMFCTTQNYVCLKQYESLEKLYQTHGKWLQIVVISADERLANMCDFRRRNNYKWDFLHYANDPDVLSHYDVRIFPTCYLIDPDGKLVLSPAPAADENIERALYMELNSNGTWSEYIKKGWIEDLRRTDKRFELDLGVPK